MKKTFAKNVTGQVEWSAKKSLAGLRNEDRIKVIFYTGRIAMYAMATAVTMRPDSHDKNDVLVTN